MEKEADLLPNVKLQPHQQHIESLAADNPLRMLLIHGLGSGKTLTSIAAAEKRHSPYTAVVPASLRANFRGEQEKFTDQSSPSSVMSYSALASGKPVPNTSTVIFDEAHRLRNPASLQSQQALEAARKAKQILMLTGTPIVNQPSDLAVPLEMLTGKHMSPEQFTDRYVGERKVSPGIIRRLMGVTPGHEPEIRNEKELKALLKGHVDYYQPEQPVVPTNYEDFPVEMGVQQTRLYKAMWDQLPWTSRWKLKHDFPLSRDELKRMTSFLTGPRQVGLSTYPYQRVKDPMRAFNQSPKLQMAFSKLQEQLKDPRQKALVFSNFIDAGLVPYSAALTKANIPHAIFHGGLSDLERKKLVADYNNNKLRVALVAPSGTEGLSFKGTQTSQLLDQYWNPIRGQQSIGRGLRFDSHTDLPEELRHMRVQRFVSRLPLGFKDRLLSRLGMDREMNTHAADDYLAQMSHRKDKLTSRFMDLLKQVGSHDGV